MPAPAAADYVGRFAPSPTGPLHFGSVLIAVASWLRARQHGGRWLLRIEDIDPPREVPGCASGHIRALARLGLKSDQPIRWQGARLDHYRTVAQRLLDQGAAYCCDCSRREIEAERRRRNLPTGSPYPGRCRDRGLAWNNDTALRMRLPAPPPFDDLLQGHWPAPAAPLPADDFVLWRRDDLPSYQLAVTVDDAEQHVTEVLRGADLITTTPRQIGLARALATDLPAFIHLPLVHNERGEKLSKQTGAESVEQVSPPLLLRNILDRLGCPPHPQQSGANSASLLQWGITNWDVNSLKHLQSVALPEPQH